MFASSLAAVTRSRSALGFKPVRAAVVVFVDGLGAMNLAQAPGHAPWLSERLAGSTGFAAYPATTSVNITSFATGLMPGSHGIIGHVVQDTRHAKQLNLLNGWDETTDPTIWQPNPTISETAHSKELPTNVIAAEEYRSTGFTVATMRQAQFNAAETLRERFDTALALVGSGKSLNYLYIPELDKFAHIHGWQSAGWVALLEQLDSELKRFASKLPKDVGMVVTADHGMIDTSDDLRCELDSTLDELGVEFFGGDPRNAFLYFDQEADIEGAESALAKRPEFKVLSSEAFEAYLGPLSPEAIDRLPDLVLVANGNRTLYHSRFSKPRSYRMIAHHGAPTDQELKIPLIRVGI